MFGLSMSEILVIAIVALVAVGPEKLPGMLRTLGEWIRKIKKLSTDVRAQSGIDDILRAEGLQGGLSELKSLVRSAQSPFVNLAATVASTTSTTTSPASTGTAPASAQPAAGAETAPALAAADRPSHAEEPYANIDVDPTREYPPEGADAYGALPDDLFDPGDLEPGPLDVMSAVPDLTKEDAELAPLSQETGRALDPSSPS